MIQFRSLTVRLMVCLTVRLTVRAGPTDGVASAKYQQPRMYFLLPSSSFVYCVVSYCFVLLVFCCIVFGSVFFLTIVPLLSIITTTTVTRIQTNWIGLVWTELDWHGTGRVPSIQAVLLRWMSVLRWRWRWRMC